MGDNRSLKMELDDFKERSNKFSRECEVLVKKNAILEKKISQIKIKNLKLEN